MRIAHLRLLLVGFAAVAAIAGCGAPGQFHSNLPPTASSTARSSGAAVTTAVTRSTGEVDGDAALADAVTAAHRDIIGSTPYGVYNGHFVPAQPAPGRPGYYLVDGEVVAAPPNDTPTSGEAAVQSAVPEAGATPVGCSKWSADVPPSCTVTGPFRRVYSDAGHSFALAHVTLPLVTTLPTGDKPLDGNTGYVYFEGWPGSGTSNSEFGFQYSATYKNYFLYAKTSTPKVDYIFVLNGKTVRYNAASTVTLALAGYTIGGQSYLHVAAIGSANFTCGTAAGQAVHTCLAHDHLLDGGWTPSSCCIMARMTTIGQTNALYSFYDGSKFGPVTWSGAELAANAPAPAPGSTTLPLTGKEPPWSGGGTQDWPPPNKLWPANLNRIVETDVADTGETDTVDLTVPALKLAISPASCQYVKKAGTVSYAVRTSGSPEGIALDYGWFVDFEDILPLSLEVPKEITNLGVYRIGPTPEAQVQIFDPSVYGGFVTATHASIFFVDALGNQRIYPAAGAASALAVGKDDC